MQSPIVNEQERHVLQALLNKGPMTSEQLSNLCKNAFGWSGAVIRRTQKSLLKQRLVTVQEGILTPAVTKEVLEDNNWDQWVGGTFEWTPSTRTVHNAQPFFKSIWFWTTCVACVVIIALCVMLALGSPAPASTNTIPEELQICKDALDKWQKNDIYYMQQSTHYQLGFLDSYPQIHQWYYVHEDNWLHLSADWNNPDSTDYPSYMYRDGELSHCRNLESKNWTPLWHLSTIPDPADYAPNPWPMAFSWDNCELIHRSTVKSTFETRINFQVVDRSRKVTDVYNVTFYLDNQEYLTCVQITTIQSDQLIRVDIYTMESTDPNVIAEAIANEGNTKSDSGVEEPIPEPG